MWAGYLTVFYTKTFKTQHGNITLRELENKKLREVFQEPRVHFAINCASMSCPKLLTESYKAGKLEEQFETQASSFINDKSKNYLDKENRILYLSSIFKWYKDDFIQNGEKDRSVYCKIFKSRRCGIYQEQQSCHKISRLQLGLKRTEIRRCVCTKNH